MNISFNESFIQIPDYVNHLLYELNKSYLYNSTINNVFQNFVYNIAMFQFSKLNIEYNPKIHYIEFLFENLSENKNFYIKCNEIDNNYIYPLLTSITYLNDNSIPTIITPFNLDSYKYKNFSNDQKLVFVFPKKGKHISFNSEYYSGVFNISEDEIFNNRYSLIIHLWNKKPIDIEYFQFITEKSENYCNLMITENSQIRTLFLDKTIINFDFFENAFYKKKHNIFFQLKDIFINLSDYYEINESDSYEYDSFILTTTNLPLLQKKTNNLLLNKYGNIIYDIIPIYLNLELTSTNRFNKYFIISEIYSKDICKWIIDEANHYLIQNMWVQNSYIFPFKFNYIKNIQSIFSFIKISLVTILTEIKKLYFIPDNIEFDTNDMLIVKLDNTDNYSNIEYNNKSFFSINILLSDYNDYIGGGKYFIEQNDTIFINQGNILVHSGVIPYHDNMIINGSLYKIVIFTNLKINIK
jgi:hypothetical protein